MYMENILLSSHHDELLNIISCVNDLNYCNKPLKNNKCSAHKYPYDLCIFEDVQKSLFNLHKKVNGTENKYKVALELLYYSKNNRHVLMEYSGHFCELYNKMINIFSCDNFNHEQWDNLMDVFVEIFKTNKEDLPNGAKIMVCPDGSKYKN